MNGRIVLEASGRRSVDAGTGRRVPASSCKLTLSTAEAMQSADPAAVERCADPGADPTSSAVVFDHVSFAFDDVAVLRDVSFVVPTGSMRLLLGPSGAGKSVLLKLILGLLKPDAGRIFVKGQRIDQMTESSLLRARADMGISFQENALFDSLTVEENVGYRLYQESDMPGDQARERVEEVLALVGLTEYIDRMPSELSGGQRRRVGVARAMASNPALLLLDDPVTGLDPIIAASVDDAIVTLRDTKHVTSILATHQIRDAFYVATHQAVRRGDRFEVVDAGDEVAAQAEFMVLNDGSICFQGSAAELLASDDSYLREFLDRTLPPW
jgi:phospholipid/cholesterol/gamma-HCH transport system ATP-binding protein